MWRPTDPKQCYSGNIVVKGAADEKKFAAFMKDLDELEQRHADAGLSIGVKHHVEEKD